MKKSVCSWRLDLDYVLPPESISDDTVSLCVCVCVGGGGGGSGLGFGLLIHGS